MAESIQTPDVACEVEEEYSVEEVLGKRTTIDGEVQYLLKWLGYPDTDNSWESEKNLQCPELIEAYEKRQEEKRLAEEKKKAQLEWESENARAQPPSPTNPFLEGYIPERIIGVTNVNQKLRFLMEFKGLDEAIFVLAKEAHKRCPDIVIKFYESKIQFAN